MKQLLILSGKGGTGKTTIASAFIKLSGVSVGSTQPYIVGRNEPILVGELRANL